MTVSELAQTAQTPSSDPAVATVADKSYKADLLEQFYLTLNVMYLGSPRVEQSAVHERIDRLFRARSWRNAYEIEQLLCFVLTDQRIAIELDRRLAEAKTLKLGHVDAIADGLSSLSPADQRLVLHRLLNDLQWFYTKRDQHRAAGKRLMSRVSALFMVALAVLFLVLFIQFSAHGPAASGGAPEPPDQPAAQNPGDNP